MAAENPWPDVDRPPTPSPHADRSRAPLPGALLFDFDGLVLDTETPEFLTVAEVFADHGLVLSRREWVAIIGTADHPHWSDMLAEALGGPVPDLDIVVERRRERHHALIAEQDLRPGVRALADAAFEAGVALAIASSSPRSWVDRHLDIHGIDHRFPVRATRDDVGAARAKPHPDLFLLAAARLAVHPARCVVLEDSVAGVTAGNAAGCVTVAVPAGMTAEADFGHAHLVVSTLEAVDLTLLGELADRGSSGG